MDIYGIGIFGYGTEIFTTPGAEIIRKEGGKRKVVLGEPAALDAMEFTRQFVFLDKVCHPEDYGVVHRGLGRHGLGRSVEHPIESGL